MIAIIGEKVGMTQVYDDEGNVVPVTVVHAKPNYILGTRNEQRDGYNAVIIAYGEKRIDRIQRPLRGRFYLSEYNRIRKALSDKETYELYSDLSNMDFAERERKVREEGLDKKLMFAIKHFSIGSHEEVSSKLDGDANALMKSFFNYLVQVNQEEAIKAKQDKVDYTHITLPVRYIREFRTNELERYVPGDYIDVSAFEGIEKVDVIGRSKGRGFTGVMKRWNFSGGPAAHGSKFHRRPGSIGATTYPGRVIKGKKMAGHYGNERVTIINLKLVSIDREKHLLIIKGAIPGPNGGIVMVRKAKRSS